MAVADAKSDDARLATLPPNEVAAVATLPANEVASDAILPPSEVASEATLSPHEAATVATLSPKEVTSPYIEVASVAILPAQEVMSPTIELICGLGAAATGTLDWIAKIENTTTKTYTHRMEIMTNRFFPSLGLVRKVEI